MKHRSALAVLAVVALVTLACSLTGSSGEEAPEPTQPPTEAGPSPEPTAETSTSPPQPTATLAPEEEQAETVARSVDGMEMVQIPAGEFLMGDDNAAAPPERPEHLVFLDAYWIDRLEVSNAQYRLCVEAGVCAEPRSWSDVNFKGDQQPAVVPWESADTYCRWAGARLPKEAEWEKAARGTDGRTWPWGDEFEANRANLSGDADGHGFTAPVGSFPNDVSPYGVLDVAGNAAEWVADWWDAEYYARSPAQNPTGPASGEQKVHRAPIANAGGGPAKCRCTVRYAADPNWEYGFRCASSTAPTDEAESPSSTEATPPVGDEATATPASAGAGESSQGDMATEWPPLQSYRIRTVTTLPEEDTPEDVEGPAQQVFIFEWNAAAPTSRMLVACVEEITIGDTRWTKMKDTPWREETLTAEERAKWEHQWSFAQFWGIEEDLEDALPEGVELVPGQIFPVPVKAAMVLDGEETVNGVHCRRYSVDTDLDYTGASGSHITGHATGLIWVADQEGIPPIIVRALMDEDLVMGGNPSHPSWEHNVTDINQPVTIEPPE